MTLVPDKIDPKLAIQSFGNPDHPAILLIMGQMASMLWWPSQFCERLADRGFRVVRYDNRDTGHSVHYAAGQAPYDMETLAEDAVLIMDRLGIEMAHIVGMSLGGMIAQILAFTHPSRVMSLTLISTSPMGYDGELPDSDPAYNAHAAAGEKVDWSDRGQVIDFVVKDMAAIAGSRHGHDAKAARLFVESDYDRSGGYQSATNHFSIAATRSWDGKLSSLEVPVTVIHGENDPIFPLAHGLALASAVGSDAIIISGGGHEIHPDDWEQYLEGIGYAVDRAHERSGDIRSR